MSRHNLHSLQSRPNNSIYSHSTSNVVSTLRHYIRTVDGSTVAGILQSSDRSLLSAEVSARERMRIGDKEFQFRRVYVTQDHPYKIGWVVDFDISFCMICRSDFSWFRGRAKHHCRACGLLVCYECSPFTAEIRHIEEKDGSRVCKNCFGLKPGVLTPLQKKEMLQEHTDVMRAEEQMLQSQQREEQTQLLQQSLQKSELKPLPSFSKVPRSLSPAPSPLGRASSAKVVLFTSPVPSEEPQPTPLPGRESLLLTRESLHSTNNRDSVLSTSLREDSVLRSSVSKRGAPLLRSPTRKSTTTPQSMVYTPPNRYEENLLEKYTEEMDRWEDEQRPRYEECYRIMRELIPLDIYKSSAKRLVDAGLPQATANRIWNMKTLWLIATHPNDIVKIHLADFRSKYPYDSLDLVEMCAIWFVLPHWYVHSDNPLEKGKAEWKDGFKSKLDEMSYKEAKGTLAPHFVRHPAYDDCVLLHLFDPDVEVRPRFHRSASYMQQAIESPLEMRRPLTQEEEDDLIWRAKYAATTPARPNPHSIRDRRQQYMDNFKTSEDDNDDAEAQEVKYRSLMDEINRGEESYLMDQDDDDISSLGQESDAFSELTPNTQQPYQQPPQRNANQPQLQQQQGHAPEMTTPESNSTADHHPYSRSNLTAAGQRQRNPRTTVTAAKDKDTRPDYQQHVAERRAKKAQQKAQQQQTRGSNDEDEDDYDTVRAREAFLASRKSLKSASGQSVVEQQQQQQVSGSVSVTWEDDVKRQQAVTIATTSSASSTSTPTRLGHQQTQPPAQQSSKPAAITIDSNIYLKQSLQPSVSPKSGARLSPLNVVPVEEGSVTSQSSSTLTPTSLQSQPPVYTPSGASSVASNGQQTSLKRTASAKKLQHQPLPSPAPAQTTTPVHVVTLATDLVFPPAAVTPLSDEISPKSLKRTPSTSGMQSTSAAHARSSNNLLSSKTNHQNSDSYTRNLYQPGSDDARHRLRSISNSATVTSTGAVPIGSSQDALDHHLGAHIEVPGHEHEYVGDKEETEEEEEVAVVVDDEYAFVNGEKDGDAADKVDLVVLRGEIVRALFEEDTERVLDLLGETLLSDFFQVESNAADRDLVLRMYWQCVHVQRYQTALFLVDEGVVSIDAVDASSGKTALQCGVEENAEAYGRELLRRGANILLFDREENCALSSALQKQCDWLLEEFAMSGEEETLLQRGTVQEKYQYLSAFVLAGLAEKAKALLATQLVSITASEATALMNACRGNFQRMKDPVETFELLMSLGADFVDA